MADATAKLTLRLVTQGTEQLDALEKRLRRLNTPASAGGSGGGGAARAATKAAESAARLQIQIDRDSVRARKTMQADVTRMNVLAAKDAGAVQKMQFAGSRLQMQIDRDKAREAAAQTRGIRTVETEMARLQQLRERRALTAQAQERLGGGGSILAGHGFTSRARMGLGLMRDATVAAYGLRFAVQSVVAVGGAMINPFMEFQKKMAEVRNKGGFDAGVTAQIAEQAKQIGRTTQFSPNEAASAAVELAAAGLNAGGIQTALPSVLRFSQASGLGTEQSSTALVETMSQFKLAASDFEHIGDVMVKAANMSTISVSDMTESLKYVGPIAATAGISLERISAIIALLGERGIKGSQAGTGLREILIGLTHPTKQAKKAMEEIGLTKKEMQAGLNDLPAFLSKLDQKMQKHKLSTPQRLEVEKMLFGAEALTDVEAIMTAMKTLGTDGKNGLQQYEDAVHSASGAMSEAAKIAGDTLAGKMAKLHASVETAQVTLGERLAPALTDLIPRLADAAVRTGNWIGENGRLISGMLELAPSIVGAIAATKLMTSAWSGMAALGVEGGASVGAAFGTSWVGAAMPVIAAGILGYGLGNVVANALGAEDWGKSLYDAIHGTRTGEEGYQETSERGSPAPAFRVSNETFNSVTGKADEKPFEGKLDIKISQDGKPSIAKLTTQGRPLAVGVNVAPYGMGFVQ